MKLRLPFLLLLLPAFAAQAQRIVVIPSPTKAAAPVNEQVYSLLCEQTTAECVDPKAVMTQKKLDWNKVKKQRIRWIVTTRYKLVPAQQGKPAQRRVTVSAQNVSTRKVQIQPAYPLNSASLLSNKNAVGLSNTFSKTLKLQPLRPKETSPTLVAQPTPPPARMPPPPAETPPPPTLDLRFEETPPEETAFWEPSAPSEESFVQEETRPLAEKKPRPYPIAALELGLQLFNHNYEFVKLSTNNLRSFKAGIQAAPALRAEFYPLAFADLGLASGIGLDAQAAMSFGFKIKDERDNKFPMRWSLMDGGLRWRMQFSRTWKAAVTPMVGLQNVRLSHGALEDGATLNGFPKLNITALRLGLGFELPLVSEWFVVFGDFSYVPVLSAKEILAAPYFPEGSAFGLEGKLGVNVKMWGPLFVRFTGFLSRTNFTLKAESGSTYVADSARYQRMGVQLGFVAAF